MRHFIKLLDYTREEILELLDLADRLKAERKRGVATPILSGKALGMIFEKSSTRTRVSFEVGMYQLGGTALFLSGKDLQIGRGEPIADTARVLSRYLDGIMIRTYGHRVVEELAAYATVPVVNGLTDAYHPCQALADLMTIREYKGGFEGLKLAYIGDGNNMANSLLVAGLKLGMRVSLACPEGYRPLREALEYAEGKPFELTGDPLAAARGADVVFTDVWTSMGMEAEAAARAEAFRGYRVDEALMGVAKPDCVVQHCLPAHRGEEIDAETFERHAGEIFDEAENRLHAQKAILVRLMG